MNSNLNQVRPAARIPVLRSDDLDPQSYARTTCFQAGYLVSKNAGWRNVRPVVDVQACTGCLQCYLYCPDGTVYKVPEESGKSLVAIDYDFCKGCGICAKMCKFGAIAMISESEALVVEVGVEAAVEAAADSEPSAKSNHESEANAR